MKEKGIPKRDYTDEFKAEAICLAESVGINESARRLGVPTATIGNWARRARKEGVNSSTDAQNLPRRPVSEPEAENSRLRKELASAKLDIEILKKATAYFARGSR